MLQETNVVSQLAESLYMDDFTGGTHNVEEGFNLYKSSKELMQKGGFNLRKWRTNSAILEEMISREEGNMSPNDQEEVKILGIIWNVNSDEFQFDFQGIIGYVQSLSPIKRSVLKLSAKIFDLLGILSPFTVGMKMLFQKVCKEKIDWEQTLDGELLIRWNCLIKELIALAKIKVPQCCYVRTATPVSHQLHGFSDASEHAFAAVIYLRTVYSDGSISVHLVASKTHVAPMKKQTIPRLELLGANTLAHLFSTVQNILKSLPQVTGYCWTDSYTVLCWLKKSWAMETVCSTSNRGIT